jgi:hypothetical protein
VKQFHIIPDDDSEDDHTTSECQCGPVEIILDNDQGFKEWVVFHFTDSDYDYLDDEHYAEDEEEYDDGY